ncbi:MAG: hypothetical protein LBS98_06470 [Coriobacteriales bacterium]|jgi:hypothetical protein|nr:hypothetical protein [Coriobacteriales bacterium]
MMGRRFSFIGRLFCAALVVVLVAGCSFTGNGGNGNGGSGESPDKTASNEKLWVGTRSFTNECIVVPPRLINEKLGTTKYAVTFDPYSRPENTTLVGTIPAGTEYYSIEGFSSKDYLALPYGRNYFLYARKGAGLISFPQSEGEATLLAEHKGTPEQAYLAGFQASSGYAASYISVSFNSLQDVDTDLLLALLEEHCELRGATLMVADFNFLVERGYFENDYLWYWDEGFFIYLSPLTLLDAEHATVEVGITAGGLAGNGMLYELTREDGAWVITAGEMSWIS